MEQIMKKKGLALYIHIPFCKKKCDYCDFLSFQKSTEVHKKYVNALIEEIRLIQGAGKWKLDTVFIGGGTPSILETDEIKRLMNAVYDKFEVSQDTEITIESNPGTLTMDKLRTYRDLGINRLSMGLQSTHDLELKLLGRIHSYDEFLQGYQMARESGFTNINVDLMSALPGQTLEAWLESLKKIAELKPEHISAYSLIIEEETPFYEQYAMDMKHRENGEECSILPSEETERRMYYECRQLLKEHGYEQYEISNYARVGKECRHNCVYWTRGDYLGVGIGAASMIEDVRFQNTSDLERYIAEDFSKESKEILTSKEQMEETMFLGLRMMNGVSMDEFESVFHKPFSEVYGGIVDNLMVEGLITQKKGRLVLTEKGVDLSNYTLAEFLL